MWVKSVQHAVRLHMLDIDFHTPASTDDKSQMNFTIYLFDFICDQCL